jgi:hypothetical protein
MTMTTIARRITGGVDTHLDVHVAAALDERGALLGVESFAATASGYRRLLAWLERFGTIELVGAAQPDPGHQPDAQSRLDRS